MTDHRPECFASMCECDETHFESTDCHLVCICPSLRACEKRVVDEALMAEYLRYDEAAIRDQDAAYRSGYAAALAAARDAVTALGHEVDCINPHEDGLPCIHDQVKSSIDALREGR